MPMNNRLLVPRQRGRLLLDLYPSAIAAFSLRSLRTSYSGSVVRVRRGSDNAEADFSASGVSDGSLAAWVGSGNDGFVRTLYDQSGNGRNMGQSTAGQQPRIVTSGALILEGGLPTLEFYNSRNDRLTTGAIFTAGPPLDSYLVARFRSFSGGGGIRGLMNSAAGLSSACVRESFGALELVNGATLGLGATGLVTTRKIWNPYFDSGTNSSLRHNGSLIGSAGNAGSSSISGLSLATDAQIAGRSGDVNIQEAVFWGAEQSSRAAIVAAINTHYTVF